MNKKVLTLLTAALTVVTIAACSENLEGGKSCPLLCPEQAVILADTTVDAVVADTTVPGLPPIGSEGYLTMLASHGDTLETRAIVRFDTLPQSYNKSSIDSTIVHIDTAHGSSDSPIVKLRCSTKPADGANHDRGLQRRHDGRGYRDLGVGDALSPRSIPRLQDVRARVAPRYASHAHLHRQRAHTRAENGTRLRVGFRVRSSVGIDLRIGTTHVGLPVTLNIYASKDTASRPAIVSPQSNTPTGCPVPVRPAVRLHDRLEGRHEHAADDPRSRRCAIATGVHAVQRPVAHRGLHDNRSRVAAAHAGPQSTIRVARLGVRLSARRVGRARR